MRIEEVLALGMFGRSSGLGDRIEMLLERGRGFSPRVSRARVAATAVALLGCVIAGALAPRLIAFAQAESRFEVATIKPNSKPLSERPGDPGTPSLRVVDPELFSATKVTLSNLTLWAYGLKSYQLSGDQGWIKSDAFDIQAKPPAPASKEQMMAMMRSLLAERFKLAFHRETKAVAAYSLTMGGSGAKLRAGPIAEVPGNSVLFRMVGPEMRLTGKQAPIPQLALWLNSIVMQSGRPVFDKTGLTGGYDFQLQWMPEDGPGGEAALMTALREQLGLELKATKEDVEILVIDHAEKPDAN